MSESNNYPNFYEPTEGRSTLETEQLAEVTREFNELFDDVMLRHMDKVKRFDGFGKIAPEASMVGHIQIGGETYTLSLRDKSKEETEEDRGHIKFRDSEVISRDISLQRIEDGYGREYWSYRLGADGVVRRWDGGDLTAKNRKDQELGIEGPKILKGDESYEEITQAIDQNLSELYADVIPNARLAEDMGMNNQPVTLEEIQGLSEFLDGVAEVKTF